MNKSILAAAVFSFVAFEGAQAGEKEFTATPDVALPKSDVSATGDAVSAKDFDAEKNSAVTNKTKNTVTPTRDAAGEKPSHGSAGEK